MPSETDVCNLSLSKLGGAGDALNGNAFIGNIDDSNKVAAACKLHFPRARRRVIKDAATKKSPFRSTDRFADLGTEVASGSLPEKGEWEHAFNLPGDLLVVIDQFDEGSIAIRRQVADYVSDSAPVVYQWEMIANSAGTGKLLLTNTLSNTDQDSAFIEYAIDTPATGGWTEEMIECVATLLAHSVAPIVGRDMESAAFELKQYLNVSLPAALRANGADFNSSARGIRNFRGRRSEQ